MHFVSTPMRQCLEIMRKRKTEFLKVSLLTVLPISTFHFSYFFACHANKIISGTRNSCLFYDVDNGVDASFQCPNGIYTGTLSSEFAYLKKDEHCFLYSLDGVLKQKIGFPQIRLMSTHVWNDCHETIFGEISGNWQIGCWTADGRHVWSTRKGMYSKAFHFTTTRNLLFCVARSQLETWDQQRLVRSWRLDFPPSALAVVGDKILISKSEGKNKSHIFCYDFEGRPLCDWKTSMFVYRLAAGKQNLCWGFGSVAGKTQEILCWKLGGKHDKNSFS